MTTDSSDPVHTAGDIPLGKRVVMRYRLPDGHEPPLTDVIGELVSLDPPTVRGGDGTVVSAEPDRVVAMKALGPRPIRVGEIRALEAAAAFGWPGIEHAWIDGWLVRAGYGFTDRANSAVPLGDPETTTARGASGAQTMQYIAEWYAVRSLPVLLALPDRLASVPVGWQVRKETVVLGIDIENFFLPQGPPMVRVHPAPDAAWLDLYHRRGEAEQTRIDLPPVPEVLTAVHEGDLGFAALGVPTPIAVGRGALTTAPDGRRWIGLSCIAVASEHRRHGLGALVCAELIRWGRDRGATHSYVQVEADNEAALALYRDLGFVDHHRYRYAEPPR
ncbi:N-acetylglutamate synthase, CG3035 family [Nocardia bovistercoris]|uniref:GNAT family N-acetyltransferase n=1 Tax=Nocardia bovistercoris TaxID=2785916 RepID=A0A931ICV4_9NOCA|nr:GNAT family N-acetyltransferase [Nocardia bovistercoris]MBH0778186.1 GNAT family N-acetyltransferase [Nocardia bovistercoris]